MITARVNPMSMLDAAILLQDPPAVREEGGMIPESEWVGRRMDEADVLLAAQNGYGRDWFRYWHRRLGFDVVWAEGGVYDRARAGKTDEDLFDNFKWNQTYIFGYYGVGKSTRAVAKAMALAAKGYPTFHNGPVIGGWLVEGDALFTVMSGKRGTKRMPKCAGLVFDEAHGVVPRRLANSTAVSTSRGNNANIRKLNVDFTLLGAQWKDVHRDILDECAEAMEMIRVTIKDGRLAQVPEWDKTSNFAMAWKWWPDFPFKRMHERERERRQADDDADEDPMGPPAKAFLMHPEAARWAFAATDSFRLVDLAAVVANKDKVKAALLGIRDESMSGNRNPYHAAVLEFAEGLRELLETEDGADPAFQHFRVSDVAYNSGLDSSNLSIALGELGIPKQPGDTYLSEDLIRALFANVRPGALIGPPPVTTADLCREAVLAFAAQLRHQPHDEWFLPGAIAAAAGLDPRPVGNALSGLGLKRDRYKGYRSEDLIRAWEAKQGVSK